MPHSLELQFDVFPRCVQEHHTWLQRGLRIWQTAVGHAGFQTPSALSSMSGASLQVVAQPAAPSEVFWRAELGVPAGGPLDLCSRPSTMFTYVTTLTVFSAMNFA